MAAGKKGPDEPIRVTDRRASAQSEDAAEPKTARTTAAKKGPAEAFPPIDFTTFVLSLSTSALTHLGEDLLGEGSAEVNLPLAKQTIDLLGLLEEKTKGNLSGEEERILEQVVTDLRMRYVAVSKRR